MACPFALLYAGGLGVSKNVHLALAIRLRVPIGEKRHRYLPLGFRVQLFARDAPVVRELKGRTGLSALPAAFPSEIVSTGEWVRSCLRRILKEETVLGCYRLSGQTRIAHKSLWRCR